MKLLFKSVLAIILSCSSIQAQDIVGQVDKVSEIDSYLKKLASDSKFMGYVILSHGDSILYQNGFGYSDIENKIPFSKNTLFCICSTGKLFTAAIIMKMVQENKIKLDDYIGKYFPELPYGDIVTIRHLLTHASGLTNYQENPEYFKNKSSIDNLSFIKTQKLKFKPGEETYYSTSGMILLGAVIEKVYAMNYKDVLKKEILNPLSMDNTLSLNYKEVLNQKESEAALPYYKINDEGKIIKRELSRADSLLIPLGAGGEISCAEDLFKFDRGLYSYKIIDKTHLNKMIEKQSKTEWEDCYFGLGIVIENAGSSHWGAGHGGCDNLYYTHFIKSDITLIIGTIEGYANPIYLKNAFAVAEDIKKILFDDLK